MYSIFGKMPILEAAMGAVRCRSKYGTMRFSRLPQLSMGLFFLLLPCIAPSQCLKSRMTEYQLGQNMQGEQIITDSTVYYYNAEGSLERSETHALIRTSGGVKYRTHYEARGDQVIREKVYCDPDKGWFIIEKFTQTYPGPLCTERRCVARLDPDRIAEKNLAYESMDEWYSMKNWEGRDQEGNLYAKYQTGSNPNVNPELFYKYEEIDGVWGVTDVLVFDKNEHGDYISIQTINAGGFGYHKQEFRYEYDECGNWIEKWELGTSGKEHLIARREIIF
jgi:hypothetical protein